MKDLINNKEITYENLEITQKTLETIAIGFINEPMTDYKELKKVIYLIEQIDELRREKWNKEKFEPYDKIADEIFSIDDIPF